MIEFMPDLDPIYRPAQKGIFYARLREAGKLEYFLLLDIRRAQRYLKDKYMGGKLVMINNAKYKLENAWADYFHYGVNNGN